MSLLHMIQGGAENGLPIIPYVYGASRGEPSPCRPDLVAAALASGRPPERRSVPMRKPVAASTPGSSASPERCRDCGYLTSAIGHRVTCGDGAP